MSNLAKIEGLLFISGDEGITVTDLSNITGFMKPAVLGLLNKLGQQYAENDDCALTLLQSDETYRLATKSSLSDVMKAYFEKPLTTPLTQALLEVLAIIAYRQPITRIEIDALRGVQSSGSIQKLIARGLIETHGRLNVPGRPFRYVTTNAFLDYFGLQTLKDLPPLTKQMSLEDMDSDIFLRALQSRQDKLNQKGKQ
ncbi:MAG: SMC-Scp complex subunit ScpB [Limosilactobacillus coleohominis]|uniref:SMC-Scp complex subunit ScpB n=2 Tax=Limosilactobacillus coleohominis TaxID=181675 RepID=UPI002A824907|nr:SMC-Scp complex subunit ScpB [Limosilactobacillus coleohominis]MCI5813243.1 SMC-Scp complex subunit ScpB [Lactobacillus sp.]MDY3702681.1 SMC-Scp complex subunit ScpB [Limosilactobacillus coleohominis]MDY5628334.1 SMC-Scp complex subunit ScpB [Limosilactobacillus coleohominis]